MNNLIAALSPVLTKEQKKETLAYYSVFEKFQTQITKDSLELLKDHPVFGKLLVELPIEEREARDELSRQLQKDAILNDNWRPYVDFSIQQGIAYAKMGLSIKSWFELMTVGRMIIIPYIQKEYGTSSKFLSAINGLNLLIDIGMSIIGEAYILEKRQIIEQDRAEIKQLNEELEQKVIDRTAKLESVNKELEQFIYVASHDLQEPLRTISNFVGLIEGKLSGKLEKNIEQYLKFIVKATSKMQNLIKDLLDLSRIGKDITLSSVDCNKILEEVLSDLEISIKENGAKITSEVLPTLHGNERELRQLFQNLMSNAIKFRKKETAPKIKITVKENDKEHLFSFKNNGIGIEEAYKEKIFVIFQRLHSASEYPGTGIGLATCKKVVEQHQGKIWVDSKLGKGSTFHFTISKKNKLIN